MKKNSKTRIISLVLALSLLFSCMTVLSYASDGTGILSMNDSQKASNLVSYNEALFMKVGVDTALLRGEKVNINPPITESGETLVPLDVVAEYLGYTTTTSGNTITLTKSGADTKTLPVGDNQKVNVVVYGETSYHVINYKDIETIFAGYYGSYNDMGVIVVSSVKDYANNATDMQLVDVMKRFIFDSIDENKSQVNVITKENFQSATSAHPYLLADQDDFDDYKAIYTAFVGGTISADDLLLGSYIDSLVKEAEAVYTKYADDNGNVRKPVSMPYDDIGNNGYDPDGGRQHGADEYAEMMKTLAFGYQVTGNEKYARLAYSYALMLGEWEHWGPSHFLNCADAAAPYAIAYDWLYNAWTDLETNGSVISGETVSVSKITEILFTHGVLAGWYMIKDVECPWARKSNRLQTTIASTREEPFFVKESNWNPVCSSGMIAATLAIAGDTTNIGEITINKATLIENDGTHEGFSKEDYPYIFTHTEVDFRTLGYGKHEGLNNYSDYAYDLFTTLQYTLPMYGLNFYAPDGSYVESPTYWAYSAKNLFAMGAYSESVFGDDFGLVSNCWGLDKTCYYALNAMSSDYSMWNYSDSPAIAVPDPIPTQIFPVAAAILGQSDLAAIRRDMIESGKYTVDYLDVFYYNPDTDEAKMPELQYHMAGIDGYVVRDSWDQGSIYAAIKGGYNLSAHGQIDSGEFVYHNNGKIWFCDPGAEHYTVPSHGHDLVGSLYYRTSAEGNNTLVLASDGLPNSLDKYWNNTKGKYEFDKSLLEHCYAGQYIEGTGEMYKTGENEYGAYSLIDQTSVYNQKAISAKRGMLFTNNRSTVIIQDEVVFNGKQTAYWIGHTYQDIYVTTDGRSAYMTDGESVIRVSLLSDNADLRFDVMTAYEFVLKDTHDPSYATSTGTKVAELDRSGLFRLVIECKDVESLNLAVVIEDVTGNENMEVGYEYTSMDSWVPSEDGRNSTTVDEVIDFDNKYYGYTTSGELEVIHSEFFNNNMLTVWAINDSFKEGAGYYAAGDFTVGSYAMINFPSGKFNNASLSGDYLVVDLEIYTDSHANGLSLSLYGNGSEIASQSLSELVSGDEGGWAHVTIIATDSEVYFFSDGALVSAINLASASYKDVAIAVTVGEAGGTISIDNVRVRKDAYTDLGALIAGGNIADWSGYTQTIRQRKVVYLTKDNDGESGQYDIEGYTFSSLFDSNRSDGFVVANGDRVRLQTNNTHAPLYITAQIRIYYYDYDCRAYSYKYSYVDNSANEYIIFMASTPITTKWHIDAETVEDGKQYQGMRYAEYTGTNSAIGKITAEIQDDGTYKFYTTAWSLTEGGKPATAEDMLLKGTNTVKECHFYLTKVEIAAGDPSYDYFRIRDNGNVEARKVAKLAEDLRGHTVVLNRDLGIEMSSERVQIKIENDTNLYLNGHTLTVAKDASGNGSYIFRINAGGYLNIYGNGGSIITNVTGAVFYVSGYDSTKGDGPALNVENTTIKYSGGGRFIDHRIAPVNFKNVTFIQTKANTKEMLLVTKDTGAILTLDGCTINDEKSKANVFRVTNSAKVVITGGTYINTPDCTAISLGSTNISVSIGDAYINAKALYQCEVTGAEQTILFTGNVYLVTNPEVASGGYVTAYQNDATYPFVVTNKYATVTWKAEGAADVTEYWLAGSMPTPQNKDMRDALTRLTSSVAQYNQKYSFCASVVNAGNKKTFTATQFNNFSIKVSLSLEASMKANIFIEKCDDVQAGRFILDDERFENEGTGSKDYTIVTLEDGKEYYRIISPKIQLTNVTQLHEFKVRAYTADGKSYNTITVQFSVIDYIEKVLTSGQGGKEGTALMTNILKYLAEAYKYDGKENTDGYHAVNALLTKYQYKATYSVVEKAETPDNSEIRVALKKAEVLLSEAPRYRFRLSDTFSGTVTLSYTVFGVAHSQTFNVVDGKYEGKAYIDLELRAYDMRCDINITTVDSEGVVGTGLYNLQTYYHTASAEDSSSTALLNALYAYSEKAEMYKKTQTK